MSLSPRIVVVHRRTELEDLVARHSTRQQAGFFLEGRGQRMAEIEARHDTQQDALATVAKIIPLDWRRGQVERTDLDRFVFGPEDIVVAVGQDGLVANVAKYLEGQPVIGINPNPDRNPGVLVRHHPSRAGRLLNIASGPELETNVEARSMVRASTDDGQSLLALNEVYIGHSSHQSARYRIDAPDGRSERQSSSGVLVGTGTGSTGWCQSVWLDRGRPFELPRPEDPSLCWFVREAWPSPATGTSLTGGTLGPGDELVITAESSLVVFGDGIEADSIHPTWSQRVAVSLADQQLRLVV